MVSTAFPCSEEDVPMGWSGSLKRHAVGVASFEVGYSQLLKPCLGKAAVK